MSDLGLWSLRGRAKACGPRFTKLVPALLLFAVLAACGSPQPPAIPEPTSPSAPPTPVLAAPTPNVPVVSQRNEPAPLSTLPSIADVVDNVKPWVASITVQAISRSLFTVYENDGDGSGIVVRPDGYIATNAHVIDGATEINVHLPDGKTYDARIVGVDNVTDLAIIKIDAQDLPVATFADADDLRVGDWVISIGNALALKGGPTVTLGIVSALGRTIRTDREPYTYYDLIQTDAAINSGNSGGPLINLQGEVVGINQAIMRQAQGVGFANSASVAAPVIDDLIEHGRVMRPLIGFVGDNVTPAIAKSLNLAVNEGVIVTRMRNGPAYDAGIRIGDVVIKMDGIPTPDVGAWLSLLWRYEVGDCVQVEYLHDNETIVTTVVLAERPS